MQQLRPKPCDVHETYREGPSTPGAILVLTLSRKTTQRGLRGGGGHLCPGERAEFAAAG